MTIEEAIEQYKLLKKSRKTLDDRVQELRKYILLRGVPKDSGLELQRRDLTSYDEDRVWQLMDSGGIPHHKFTKKVIAPELIEQLYLEGTLTDDDLRAIRAPKYTYALVEVDKSVQELDDS